MKKLRFNKCKNIKEFLLEHFPKMKETEGYVTADSFLFNYVDASSLTECARKLIRKHNLKIKVHKYRDKVFFTKDD